MSKLMLSLNAKLFDHIMTVFTAKLGTKLVVVGRCCSKFLKIFDSPRSLILSLFEPQVSNLISFFEETQELSMHLGLILQCLF